MSWSMLLRNPLDFLWIAINTRSVRFMLYVLIVAALFPSSRFILFLVVVLAFSVVWFRDYRRVGSKKFFYLLGVLGIIVIGYAAVYYNVINVESQRISKSPWGDGVQMVQDGTYQGAGQGFRGPIRVAVTVKDHRITDVKTLDYYDLISVLDNDLAQYKNTLVTGGKLVRPAQPQMYRGAGETLTGYVNAVETALIRGIPDYPMYSPFSKVYLSTFLGASPNAVTLNALAILFAVFMVFEYTLQSMLNPGTGRAINCYNCASCVGACPVKEVEGVQMPMGLILLTRLGDYERVKELSKYCVGCGKCAIKCPIGNSGPMVISAAFQADAERKRQEAGKKKSSPETA